MANFHITYSSVLLCCRTTPRQYVTLLESPFGHPTTDPVMICQSVRVTWPNSITHHWRVEVKQASLGVLEKEMYRSHAKFDIYLVLTDMVEGLILST